MSGWVRLGKGKRLHWLNGPVTGCGRIVKPGQAVPARDGCTYPYCRPCRRAFQIWQQASKVLFAASKVIAGE